MRVSYEPSVYFVGVDRIRRLYGNRLPSLVKLFTPHGSISPEKRSDPILSEVVVTTEFGGAPAGRNTQG